MQSNVSQKSRRVPLKVACVIVAVLTLACAVVLFVLPSEGGAEAASVKQGSTGATVRQIQTKLKNWGYYTGTVDGIYGSKTTAAVKYFQRKNGLTADGVVGPKTAAAMGITLTGSSSASTGGSGDLNLLARLVYGEARGEPYLGQVAVAAVVLNRVKSSSFPNTVSGVIYQTGAFDVVTDGQINLTPNDSAKRAAQDALNGWDPTNGCLFYYNPSTATSAWIRKKPVKLSIGNHVFC
ncbi:MAG: spore cortex-lytic enzyme [Clostridia bacterium]|nr:spore cortex-lytic enzyme [Clostridia bacterium]